MGAAQFVGQKAGEAVYNRVRGAFNARFGPVPDTLGSEPASTRFGSEAPDTFLGGRVPAPASDLPPGFVRPGIDTSLPPRPNLGLSEFSNGPSRVNPRLPDSGFSVSRSSGSVISDSTATTQPLTRFEASYSSVDAPPNFMIHSNPPTWRSSWASGSNASINDSQALTRFSTRTSDSFASARSNVEPPMSESIPRTTETSLFRTANINEAREPFTDSPAERIFGDQLRNAEAGIRSEQAAGRFGYFESRGGFNFGRMTVPESNPLSLVQRLQGGGYSRQILPRTLQLDPSEREMALRGEAQEAREALGRIGARKVAAERGLRPTAGRSVGRIESEAVDNFSSRIGQMNPSSGSGMSSVAPREPMSEPLAEPLAEPMGEGAPMGEGEPMIEGEGAGAAEAGAAEAGVGAGIEDLALLAL